MARHFSAAGEVQRLLKSQKIKRTALIFMAIMGMSFQVSAAQPPASVVILPFEIFSEADMSYLQTEIPAALKKSNVPGLCYSFRLGYLYRYLEKGHD